MLQKLEKLKMRNMPDIKYWFFANQMTTTPVYPLWRSLCIVTEMLSDRKYEIPDNYPPTIDEFTEIYSGDDTDAIRKEMKFSLRKVETTTCSQPECSGRPDYNVAGESKGKFCSSHKKKGMMDISKYAISVFWKVSIGTNDVQEIFEAMKEAEVNRAIVIYTTKITPYAATALRNLMIQKMVIETFSEAEMQYNVIKHVDVPRHIVCSATKKAQVLKWYSVTPEQIPQIKVSDVQCRYLGAAKGQLIKIIRPSDSIPEVIVPSTTTTEEKKQLFDITYRIVV